MLGEEHSPEAFVCVHQRADLAAADWNEAGAENPRQCDIAGIVVKRVARSIPVLGRGVSAIRGIRAKDVSTTAVLIEMDPLHIHGADFSLYRSTGSIAGIPIAPRIRYLRQIAQCTDRGIV